MEEGRTETPASYSPKRRSDDQRSREMKSIGGETERRGRGYRGRGKGDVPRITTFLTSLLTMRTSDPDLSSLLPWWGHVVALSPVGVLMHMIVFFVLLLQIMIKTVSMRRIEVVRGGEGCCPV